MFCILLVKIPPSNALLICETLILSPKIYIQRGYPCASRRNILWKACSCVKSAFSDVLVCPNCSKYSIVASAEWTFKEYKTWCSDRIFILSQMLIWTIKQYLHNFNFHGNSTVFSSKTLLECQKTCKTAFYLPQSCSLQSIFVETEIAENPFNRSVVFKGKKLNSKEELCLGRPIQNTQSWEKLILRRNLVT